MTKKKEKEEKERKSVIEKRKGGWDDIYKNGGSID